MMIMQFDQKVISNQDLFAYNEIEFQTERGVAMLADDKVRGCA